MPTGFEHHRSAGLQQALHQRVDVFLQQWLTAGDFDERTAVPFDPGHHVVDRHLPALVEGIRSVAPRAPQVAGGQADEDARLAGPRRFALDRMENLVNRQH